MWSSGDVIVRREVLHGRPWTGMAVRVVEDRDDLLATYTPEGTPFGFPEHPFGPHPYHGKEAWHGHGVLALQRPGEAHSILVFWRGPEREFAGWYVNLQDPFRHTPIGIDTLDHVLDIWIPARGRWRWKDREGLEESVRAGRFTPEQAAAIRAEGERVAGELDAGRRWWDGGWAAWTPDRSWTPEPLPEGWDAVLSR
jgi:hypothetical protein